MAGLGIFPESGLALIYAAFIILIIGFIWLLFERPKIALTILEGIVVVLFNIVKFVVLALWRVAEWIGKFIGRMFR